MVICLVSYFLEKYSLPQLIIKVNFWIWILEIVPLIVHYVRFMLVDVLMWTWNLFFFVVAGSRSLLMLLTPNLMSVSDVHTLSLSIVSHVEDSDPFFFFFLSVRICTLTSYFFLVTVSSEMESANVNKRPGPIITVTKTSHMYKSWCKSYKVNLFDIYLLMCCKESEQQSFNRRWDRIFHR